MKKISAFAILLTIMTATYAAEFTDFINALNVEWSSTNYTGYKQVFEARLAARTNDLAALVVKSDYYTSIELNMAIATTVVQQISQVRASLNWSSDEQAGRIVDEMVHAVENPEEAENAGYVFGLSSNQLSEAHQVSPTNHMITEFIPRIAVVQYGSAD